MKALKNHPGMWMRDDAAEAINALEDKYGPIIINRAGQTEAQQQAVIDRWDRGDREGLFEPKRPARLSTHVIQGGIGVDVYNYTSDRDKLEEFGFEWYGPVDPVHYTFTGWNPPAATNGKDDEEMIVNIQGRAGSRQGGAFFIRNGVATFLGDTVSGVPTVKFAAGTKLLALHKVVW